MTSFINIKLLVSYLMILTLNFAVFEINLAIPFYDYICLVVIQLLSRVQLFATPWTAAHQASLSFTIFQSLLNFMFTESVMPSNHLSSVVPFSFCLQSFPASGSFLMSWLFASGGQSSSSITILLINIQDWFPLGWTGWISLQSKGLSRVFSSITVQKLNSLALSFLYSPTLTSVCNYWKNHSFD